MGCYRQVTANYPIVNLSPNGTLAIYGTGKPPKLRKRRSLPRHAIFFYSIIAT